MLVFTQVSSMKTRRVGSSRPWYFLHCCRRRAIFRRSCSAAKRLFFKSHSPRPRQPPNRSRAGFDAELGKLNHHLPHRDVGILEHPFQHQLAMRLQEALAVTSHLLGRRSSGQTLTLRPLHNTPTLTPKITATSRHVRPDAIAATTRSRRSLE